MVVDACVAAKWHLTDEEYADRAATVLTRLNRGQIDLLAPRFIRCGVTSAITLATQRTPPRLTFDQGEAAIRDFLNLSIELFDEGDLLLPAYALVRQFGCAIYDAIYVALAQRLGLPFITADYKLFLKVGQLADVIWIGSYPQTSL